MSSSLERRDLPGDAGEPLRGLSGARQDTTRRTPCTPHHDIDPVLIAIALISKTRPYTKPPQKPQKSRVLGSGAMM